MKKAKFFTPVVTAFREDGSLDIAGNKAVYESQIRGGMDGIVVMGSTGEFFAMTTEQKQELVRLAVETVDHRIKVLVGTSCMTVEDTVAMANYAVDQGADAVMIISPWYFSLSDEDVEYYYDQVVPRVHGDVYLYNFPARTGHDLSPQVTLNLLKKHKNIVGYKDTVVGMDHTRTLLETVRYEFPEFQVLSGFDDNFVHNILAGGSGCIGGLSNVYPEYLAAWRDAVNDRDMEKCGKMQKKIDQLFPLYSVATPFVPIVKKAMILRGLPIQDVCTKPILPATPEQTEKIKMLMETFEKEE